MKYWLTAFLAGVSAPAMAGSEQFVRCDGYAAPTKKADNMTRSVGIWGLTSDPDDIRKSVQRLGKQGIVACDDALSDPLLLPKFWLRRANLLQAKAGHLIASGSAEDGLKILAEVDAVGAANAGGPLFDRSLANGNRALRAFAYQTLWRTDEAKKEIATIKDSRKWSAITQSLAADLEVRLDPKRETYFKSLKASIPLSPNVALPAFAMSLALGRNDLATDFASHVNFSQPIARGGYVISGADRERYNQINERAEFAGEYAYALAATGKISESKAVIDMARTALRDAAEPPLSNDGKKISKRVQTDFTERKIAAEKGSLKLQQWQEAITMRDELPKLSFEEALDRLAAKKEKKHFAVDMVFGDLLGRVKTETTTQRDSIKSFVDGYFGELEAEISKVITKGQDDFMGQLPRAETPQLVPSFKKSGNGFILAENGFSHRLEDDGKTHLVRFIDFYAVKETVEELALLGAARSARAEGKDSLLILFNTLIERTQNIIYHGQPVLSNTMGYEAQMRVLFLNSKALQADQEPFRWRLIPVDQVIADLEPRYIAVNKSSR